MPHLNIALRDELASCDNHVKWLNIVVRLAKRHGFAYATLMTMPKPSDRFFSQTISASNLPTKLVQSFDQLGTLHQCPIFASFSYSIQPTYWTVDDLDADDPIQADFRSTLDEHSINSGIMFSLHTVGGERYILRFEGKDCALSQIDVNDLCMQSIIAFDHFQKMRRSSILVGKSLTKREIEVVKWTAQGKTSSEIASILSLSDHTVNAYMNNAIKKLECVNRTQLVAKAIRLKLIN